MFGSLLASVFLYRSSGVGFRLSEHYQDESLTLGGGFILVIVSGSNS